MNDRLHRMLLAFSTCLLVCVLLVGLLVTSSYSYTEVNEWKEPNDFFIRSGDLWIMTEHRADKLKELVSGLQEQVEEQQKRINNLIRMNETYQDQDCS